MYTPDTFVPKRRGYYQAPTNAEKFNEGHERTFGKSSIFKNLAKREADNDGEKREE